jgi:hypothetical protein
LIEYISKGEVSDAGREVFNWLIEIKSKSEMGDVSTRKKIMNWLIEMGFKGKLLDFVMDGEFKYFKVTR